MEASSSPPYKISEGEDHSPRSAWEETNSEEMRNPSFYDSFCKFSVIIKCLGFLPITFTKSSSNLKFSFTSLLTLSSLLGFASVYMVLLTWFSVDDPLVHITMYLSLALPLVGKVLFICQLSELIRLLQLMDSVDRDKCFPQAEENVSKKSTKAILGFVSVTVVTTLTPQNFMSLELSADPVHTYVCRCHSVICLVSQLAIYYFICYQMCSFYDRYHSSLATLVDRPCEEVTEEAVEDHRIAHGKLVNCIRLLDGSFSPFLGFIYFIVNIRCLTECYDFIYNERQRSRTIQALQMIVLLVFVYYPAVITDRFIQKNKNTIKYVLRMSLKPFPDDVLFQLTYFLRHLKMNVAHVSAAGVTEVNKELITKALSLFATFFVATLQLEPMADKGLAALRQTLIELKSKKG